MHRYTPETDEVARKLIELARWRTKADPVPLGAPATPRELQERTGPTITPGGLGGHETLRIFRDVIANTTLSIDHPRYLAFVPCAPTEYAILADLLVSSFGIYGGSWLEGAGAVHAENQALRWIADLAGMPAGAGGCFVSGGTIGNLSALVAARFQARRERSARAASGASPDAGEPRRWAVVCGESAHSSVRTAAGVMDVDLLVAPVDAHGRLGGAAVEATIAAAPAGTEVFAVVATAGTTNAGIVDDLASTAAACRARGVWLHVDGAYGGAGLAAPSARDRFAGIEHADSFVIDPHKWFFAPYDCSALLYRNPTIGRDAHTQHAAYLEPLGEDSEWNPSDFAIHLTRRPRGLPFWFSLAAEGTDAYRDAVETTLTVTRGAAARIASLAHLELLREPELSVILFRRRGWSTEEHELWSEQLLADGVGLVVTTQHEGRCALRLCIVNPRTTLDDIETVLRTLD
jgi:L-2,4-diaminobutyrate decarboxylase